jgi:hypothetical protein
MNYTEYKYLWMPRAGSAMKIPRSQIAWTEKHGFGAQKKKNGTGTMIFANAGKCIFKDRHNTDHKLWKPKAEHFNYFTELAERLGGGWCVFAAELLHSKVPGIRDQLYIFDMLVINGEYQYGSRFDERMKKMMDLFINDALSGGPRQFVDLGDRYRVDNFVTVAKTFPPGSNFLEMFDHLAPEDEGLVFKQMHAKLLPCIKENSNEKWQLKCRIGRSTLYAF